MIDDNEIIKIFFNNIGRLNSNLLTENWLNKHTEIKTYLDKRYNDSTSYKETIYRILYQIEIRPVCKICGKPVSLEVSHRWTRNRNGYPFLLYCSSKCQANDPLIKEKHKNTSLLHYGVDNPAKAEEVKSSIAKTTIDRYGVKNVFAADEIKNKIKNTNIERYGVDQIFKSPSKEFIEKSKQTCIKKYGTTTYSQSEEFKENKNVFIEKSKQTCIKKYGVSSYSQSEEFKEYMRLHKDEFNEKQYNTKRKNKSFNISIKEETLFQILLSSFNNVIRQYRSKEYPFACDFYLPDINLYIEYNGSWTHNNHPYNSENDENEYNMLKIKSETSKYYKNALYTWTILDVKKYNIAKTNKLNYLIIYSKYSLEDIPMFIKDNYNKDTSNKQLVIGDV